MLILWHMLKNTLPVKSLDTPSHLMVFLYFHECIKIMNEHIWNYVVNKKVQNNSKDVLYFRFFKIASLCFDYCFVHSWHSLDELHEVVT